MATKKTVSPNLVLVLEACESGRYAAGKGRLCAERTGGAREYCFYGVACEVYREATGRGEWRPVDDLPATTYAFDDGEGPCSSVLPPDSVESWLGWPGWWFEFDENGNRKDVAAIGLSDMGVPLPEIAARIRKALGV